MKKFFSLVLALVMALSLTTVAWGAPVADTAAAQAALNAATDGTTIQLAPGVAYDALTVVPTANSNTTYKCNAHGEYTDAAAFQAHMAEAGWHGTPTYTTTLKNLTIVGAEGATVEGFVASSGHAYGTVHDYVLDKDVSGSAYYFILKIENLVFENVDFTGNVNICTSQAESVYDGVTFDGCTFTTGGTASGNGAAIRYYNENNNGNVKNLTVNNCSFDNCYQGVYTGHVNGITVTDCTFDTLGHNAVAVQDQGSCDHGDVVITENEFKNVDDRVIRFNEVGAGSDIIINNNVMEDCGDDAGELIKAASVDSAATVDLEANYWDGEDVDSGVIAGVLATTAKPTTYYTTAVNGALGGLTGVASTPASAAKGAYLTANMDTLSVYPGCDLDTYTYSLEHYTSGNAAAKTFDQKALWSTHKVTGAKVIEAVFVVAASAESADYAFVNGSQITYLSDVAGYTGNVTVLPTVDAKDADACGEMFVGGDYAAYTDANGKLYVEKAGGAVYNAGGKYVELVEVTVAGGTMVPCIVDTLQANPANYVDYVLYVIGHEYGYDTVTVKGETEVTAVFCKECKASFEFVEGTEAKAIAKFGAGNYNTVAAKLFVAKTAGAVSAPSTDKVTSAETFDAGIAMYVGMSVMAAAGSAVVLKKRED